jgi:hypothetical protein
MSRQTKKVILYFVFILNLLVFSAYGILDLLDIVLLGKLNFTLLLFYEIISFIFFTEILLEKGESPKGD